MIVLLTGLPGTGKSYLARELARAIDADVLDRDQVRNCIFPSRDLDYSPEQNELASQVVYQVTNYILQRDPTRTLILDGRPFSRQQQIDEVLELAASANQMLRIVHCTAPEEVVRKRLAADLMEASNHAAGRTMEKYLRIKRSFEPILAPHIIVDTSASTKDAVQRIIAYLEKGTDPPSV